MKNFYSDAYVVGTAALQPNCSRHSNENEKIIAFPPQAIEPEFYSIDFKKLVHAKHLGLRQRVLACVQHLLQKSDILRDLRTGSIAGKPFFEGTPRYKMVLAGFSYSLVALIALFIAV